MTKILFFGDIVGKPGRKAMRQVLPQLRQQYQPDFVIANVENLAHGKGVTLSTMAEIDHLGIDVYTSGNHIFKKSEAPAVFEKYQNLIRPANYEGEFPGRGFVRIEKNGQGYLIINLNARVFFENQFPSGIRNPFLEFDQIYTQARKPGDIVFVDFHSEVTSEKKAFG